MCTMPDEELGTKVSIHAYVDVIYVKEEKPQDTNKKHKFDDFEVKDDPNWPMLSTFRIKLDWLT